MKESRKTVLKWIVLCSAGIFAILFYALWVWSDRFDIERWDKQSLQVSMSRGNEIADALKSYKKENGRFPKTIDELVPKYIHWILPPEVADVKKWKYSLTEKGFYLEFGNSSYREPVAYRTEQADWIVDPR
jgi:hypothetical protein